MPKKIKDGLTFMKNLFDMRFTSRMFRPLEMLLFLVLIIIWFSFLIFISNAYETINHQSKLEQFEKQYMNKPKVKTY